MDDGRLFQTNKYSLQHKQLRVVTETKWNEVDFQNLQQLRVSCVELWSKCWQISRHLDAEDSYRYIVQ